MVRIRAVGVIASIVLCLCLAASASAAPTQLLLPQSIAFSILGHSCGGIQEQSFATGFDATSGDPNGDVYIQTRCGGSGRGGGYHVTTYSAWVGVTWDFGGNVLAAAKVTTGVSVDPAFTATDANGDTVYNTGTAAFLTVPAPTAPTGVSAVQIGDQFQVSWTPSLANPAVITSSTLTATPVGSTAPVVTATVTGPATTGTLGPLQPQTTYAITVVNSDSGGSSPASDPVDVTTASASVVPSAPTGVKAHWTAPGSTPDTLVATWAAAAGGDSPVDSYQVQIKGSDGGGTFTETVDGSSLAVTFSVSDIPDWTIQVRAHNAAGWSAWSVKAKLGGA